MKRETDTNDTDTNGIVEGPGSVSGTPPGRLALIVAVVLLFGGVAFMAGHNVGKEANPQGVSVKSAAAPPGALPPDRPGLPTDSGQHHRASHGTSDAVTPPGLPDASARAQGRQAAHGHANGKPWAVTIIADAGLEYSSEDGHRIGKNAFSLSPESPVDHFFVSRPDQQVIFGVARGMGLRVVVEFSDGSTTTESASTPFGKSTNGVFVVSRDTPATPVGLKLLDQDGTVLYAGEAHGRRVS